MHIVQHYAYKNNKSNLKSFSVISQLWYPCYRDEVVENESQDQSVRFVQWIKSNDSHSRRRASVQETTLRILTKNNSALSQQLQENISQEETTSPWHCLENAHGIELCTVAASHDGDYEEMEDDLEGTTRRQSDLLCAT
jgi:hypothetical protein